MDTTLDGDNQVDRINEMDRMTGQRRDRDHEHNPDHAQAEANDLTLGMPALLGIFFAIVIVCALFFGFGYSIGHHGPKPATVSVAPAPATPVTAPPLEAASQPVGTVASPAASGAAKPSPAAEMGPSTEEAVPPPVQPAGTVENTPATAGMRTSAAPASGFSPAAVTGIFMVQIAAVVHAPDAEALAAALRHDGYSAVVRTEPQDQFLHVQVGPFPTRDAARAMRARLQAAGYSPILKP